MSTDDHHAGDAAQGADRRSYLRTPVRLDALLALDGAADAVPCQVRDFCIAGMFLAVDPQAVRAARAQSGATLFFALIVAGVRNDYQMRVAVARVISAGFGVKFVDPDPRTVTMLQALATPPEVRARTDTPAGLSATQRRFAPEFRRVLPPLIDAARRHIGQASADFVRAANDALFLGARDATSNVEQRRYLDAQTEFGGRRERIAKEVPLLVEKGLAILNNPLHRDITAKRGPAATPELSLVGIDEFEEFLTVSEIVALLEPRNKDALHDLEKRLSWLANREIGGHDDPLGPAVLCNVFAEMLGGLRSDRASTHVMYKSLQKCLEVHLPRLYEEVNALLVRHGILPVVEKERTVVKRAPGDARGPAPTDGAAAVPGPVSAAPPAPVAGAGPGPQTSGPGAVPPPAGAPAPAPWFGDPGAAPAPNTGGVPFVQAAYPAPPAGPWVAPASHPGVVAAPGGLQWVTAAPPAAPVPVTAASGPVTGMVPLGAGTGVFGSAPAVFAAPTFGQAYSTAQAQLALKRRLLPGTPAVAAGGAGNYSRDEIMAGLDGLQRSLAARASVEFLDANTVRQRVMDGIVRAGGAPRDFAQTQGDALEIIANLFGALFADPLLTEAAKAHLQRLQIPVHKVALMDPSFFESSDHPVRRLLDGIGQVRTVEGPEGETQNARITDLVGRVSGEFEGDVSVFEPILRELDAALRGQAELYAGNVEEIVRGCEEQQKMLRARREKSLESTDERQIRTSLPAEWNRWLDRCKELRAGDRLVMDANTGKPHPVTLAWVGEDYNPYVFVDAVGRKVATLTLQQVAMNFRRGIIKALADEHGDAVDRALYSMVNRIHGQVANQATRDELTGFLNRKAFLQAVERGLPVKSAGERGAVLCQVTIDNLRGINDTFDTDAGDQLIKQVADGLRDSLGERTATFGRLGGGEIGIFWERGGLKTAYQKVRACFDAWKDLTIDREGQMMRPEVSGGITSVADAGVHAEHLLGIVAEACAVARASADKTLYVAGSEDREREQLDQMVAYVDTAVEKQRLVLMGYRVRPLAAEGGLPARHVIVSAEDRNGNLIPAEVFMLAAAMSPRAFDIDQWVLRRSLAWMVEHSVALEALAAMVIPLTRAALEHEALASFIVNELMQTPVPPGKLCFEIRDQDLVGSMAETTELIRTLREFGCRFVLDEFGSGRQNYDYIKDLGVDFVTIQTAFVQEAGSNPRDFAMAKSINELAHFMGIKTIVRQDGAADTTATLAEIGVDFVYELADIDRFID